MKSAEAAGHLRRLTTNRPSGPRSPHPLDSILDLDFLPLAYRDRQAKRRIRLWQLAVVFLFGGVVAASALLQSGLYFAARQRIKELSGPYAQTQAQMQQLALLQEQLRRAEQTATLYVYLQHPWPRTQILRAATDPLPPSIELEQLEILLETPPSPPRARTQQPQREPAADASQQESPQFGPEQDLRQMREEGDHKRTVVQLTGIAGNAADLHKYLADVVTSPLICEAELRSLESAGDQPTSNSSRFAARLVVLPGFGQPNGPSEPLREPLGTAEKPPQGEETVE